MRAQRWTAVLIAGLCFATTSAHAVEFYADIFGGIAQTRDRNLEAALLTEDQEASITPDYDDSFSGGIRAGFWPVSVPWLGFAQDFSYFGANKDSVAFDVYSTSSMLMLRAPLGKSQTFPTGRIYPYVGLGPSLYYATADIDLRPALSRPISDDTVDVGFQALAGLAWRLDRNIAVFGEYRFTHRRVLVEEGGASLDFCLTPCPVTERAETTLKTHHFLVGVSFWF